MISFFRHYNLVKKFSYFKMQNYGENVIDTLELTLCNNCIYDNDECTLKFYNVKDIKINDLSLLMSIHISIIDVSERQLENMHYYVTDDENNIFSFYCQKYSINDNII